jgi:hypothetical protein
VGEGGIAGEQAFLGVFSGEGREREEIFFDLKTVASGLEGK